MSRYRHDDSPPLPFFTADNLMAAAMHRELKIVYKILMTLCINGDENDLCHDYIESLIVEKINEAKEGA